jgi:hypothetical protein
MPVGGGGGGAGEDEGDEAAVEASMSAEELRRHFAAFKLRAKKVIADKGRQVSERSGWSIVHAQAPCLLSSRRCCCCGR